MSLNFHRRAPWQSPRGDASRWQAQAAAARGFTLLEMLAVVVIVSVLMAIGTPSLLAFLNTYQLNLAQEEVFLGMRTAQSQTKVQHLTWQFSVREVNGVVQWAIHPATQMPTAAHWHSLNPSVQLDLDVVPSPADTDPVREVRETTLQAVGEIRRVQFDDRGHTNGQLGRLTLRSRDNPHLKRCVIVSTLLGGIRLGKDHSTKQDGRYCY